MAVLLETSVGDLTLDLLPENAPQSCTNFLKLCKMKYYNYSPIYFVQPGFSFQTGDPLGPDVPGSDGGSSIWGLLSNKARRSFFPEFHPKLKHIEKGTVSFATSPSKADPDRREASSQFIITLGDNLDYLDGKAAIFGQVAEGFDVLEKINSSFIDENGRPLKDIRIRHTIVLDEADLVDPEGLVEPTESPLPTPAQLATVRIADDEEIDENVDQSELEKLRREREARAQALTLEMVGDLPFAEVAPPENVLFVCKLNPATRDEDLELIFSQFGKIFSCEVIKDKRTGDSLQYAFIEFAEQKSCEQAYFKMQDVLIDDHRIHVDFSQSVSRLAGSWRDDASKKRRRGGGFGGLDHLEKRSQYRGDHARRVDRDSYGMVFDDRKRAEAGNTGSHQRPTNGEQAKPRARSRSPRRHRSRSRENKRSDREYNGRGARDHRSDRHR